MAQPIPVMKKELDLFQNVSMQTNYAGFKLERISSINGGTDPLEFKLNGSGEDYVWPLHHYLLLQVQILNADRSALVNGDTTAPVNNFIHSLWNDLKVTINGTVVTPKEENYAYKSLIEKLLSFGDCAIDSQGEASLFIKDTAGAMDHMTNNLGAVARSRYIAESNILELLCPLNIDLFQAGKVLPNGCDISIKLSRNKPEFSLMMPDDHDRKIEIPLAELVVVKPKLSTATALGHAAAFQKDMAVYPIRRTEVKTAVIEGGVKSKTLTNICTGQLPRRVFLGLVSNEAFNGHRGKNPFNFHHYNLNYLALSLDGELTPNLPLTPNFADDLFLESYMSLFMATGKFNRDEGLIITRSDYSHGYTLYGFDLSPDQSADAVYFDNIRSGNFKVDLKFAEATPHAVNVVFLLEFDNVIRIDRSRRVVLDY